MSYMSSSTRQIRRNSMLLSLGIVVLLAGLLALAGCRGQSGGASVRATSTTAATLTRITEYALPTAGVVSYSMTEGGDGAVWFGEGSASGGATPSTAKIGRIGADGMIREYPFPTLTYAVAALAKGSDGNVWYARVNSPSSTPSSSGSSALYVLGRISPTGTTTEFRTSDPLALAAGSDGALWFTALGPQTVVNEINGKIGRITMTGEVSEFSLPKGGIVPGLIASGADGALWFTYVTADASQGAAGPAFGIGRITTTGAVTLFPLPATAGRASGLISGPDGNLWLAEAPTDKGLAPHLARFTQAGVYTQFPLKGDDRQGSLVITVGPDDAIWVGGVGLLERFTTSGVETSLVLPDPTDRVMALTAGPNRTLWFSELPADSASAGKIARLS
jgi:virginiamycin B lyase